MTHQQVQRIIIVCAILIGAVFAFKDSARPAQAANCSSSQTPLSVTILRPDNSGAKGIRFRLYRQLSNNGIPVLGSRIMTANTNEVGQWHGCVSSTGGPIALTTYRYRPHRGELTVWYDQFETTDSGLAVTGRIGRLSLTFRNPDGGVLRNREFAVFEQSRDAGGRLIVTNTTVVSSKLSTGDSGRADLDLGPGTYVIRIAGSAAKYPIILSDRTVHPGTWTIMDEPLPALRVTVTDGLLKPLVKYPVVVNLQQQTNEGRNIPGPVMTSGAKTNSIGNVDLYLPVGAYVATVNGSFKQFMFRRYDQIVQAHAVTRVHFRLSGIRLIARMRSGDFNTDFRYTLHEQQTNPNGQPGIAATITRDRLIGRRGYQDLYMLPGTYIIESGKQRYEQIQVYANQMTRFEHPRMVTYRLNDQVSIKSPLTNKRLAMRARSMPDLANLKGVKQTVGQAYRVHGASMTAPYTVVFGMTVREAAAAGAEAGKLRLAYFDEKKRGWRLVGKYDPKRKHVAAVLSGNTVLVLVETP